METDLENLADAVDGLSKLLCDWMSGMQKTVDDCVHSRDMRQNILVAEMNEERQRLRNHVGLLSRLVQYVQREGSLPECCAGLSLDELVSVAETFDEVSQIKPVPCLTEEEAIWIVRAKDIARKAADQYWKSREAYNIHYTLFYRGEFDSINQKALAYLRSIDSQNLERAREERWYE